MAKKQTFDIKSYLENNLQGKLQREFGNQSIKATNMPEYFGSSLNPLMPLRPYQKEAFQYFINFMEHDFDGKPYRPHLLFHMATGSGKTLIMAGLILYLYQQGYRNFLFIAAMSNVIVKTEDNLFNVASQKYQFAPSINIEGKQIEIRRVENFQGCDDNCINICLTTIQKLKEDLNTPKEGGASYSDFCTKGLVLISDEAHHSNIATKKGKTNETQFELPGDDFSSTTDWESTIMRIFNLDAENGKPNMLLEFTATEDFTEPSIAEKYKDKIIFDYPLRRFREDRYSKDIAVVQSDSAPIDRAIQAIILSQYRRKLFTAIRQNIKPVIMFKSKTIKDNKAFYSEFVQTVKGMTIADLHRIRTNAKDDILNAFTYIEEKDIRYENFLLELQDDFKEDNLLLIDDKDITPEKQAHLNSLEDKDNEYRAVFAVDMLNEGWDVLNLYDIVRLYDTRDAKNGIVGKTTNAEAQLIGRGARYMPFVVQKDEASSMPAGKRKFDNDLTNRLRILETLHYHAAHNPRYIQELNMALTNNGIIAAKSNPVTERLKEEFKKTQLYTHGYVFINERKPYQINETETGIGKAILEKTYWTRIKSGDMEQSMAFSTAPQEATSFVTKKMVLGDFSKHILRAAINRFPIFTFHSLSKIYPRLKSIAEFIESENYLAKIQVNVLGKKETIDYLSQKDKLNIVFDVLTQITPLLAQNGIGYRGTKEFKQHPISQTFSDHTFLVAEGGEEKEEGKSIKDTQNDSLRLDVGTVKWFAYDDNFGTSEEKALIKYIESRMNDLKKKYEDIYLLRNHKDLMIFDFKEGRATEPDFVLFMRRRGTDNEYDNLQIFIESKGEHLRKKDAWKEEFEKDIHSEGIIHFHTPNQKFEIWGLPFYTESKSKEFEQALKDSFSV